VNGHLGLLLAIYYNSEMAENCTTHPLHLLCCFIKYLGYFAFIMLLLCIMLSDFSKIEFSAHILLYFTILMIFSPKKSAKSCFLNTKSVYHVIFMINLLKNKETLYHRNYFKIY